MKNLMILGASEPQSRLTQAAKELGYKTTVLTIEGEYPGIKEADEVFYIDITDNEAVYQKAKELNVDGITSCCFDIPLESLGYSNDKLGLKGLSYKGATLAANKLLMKNAFEAKGVNTARFREIASLEDLEVAMEQLNFPLIVKAVDLAASVGIYKAETKKQAISGFKKAMELTKKEYCIIEEFIEGIEFGAQAFIYEGNVEFVLMHGDTTFVADTAMPIGHYVPYEIAPEVEAMAKEIVEKAIHAIELDNCAVNVDLILRGDEVFLIELTGRAGATCLVELVSIYYGLDYYKAIAMVAVGDDPRDILDIKTEEPVGNLSLLLMNHIDGVVESVENLNKDEDYIYELSLDIKEGSKVNKYRSSKDKVGQIIVTGDNYEICQERMDKVVENLKIVVK